jgi:alpha-glucosidase
MERAPISKRTAHPMAGMVLLFLLLLFVVPRRAAAEIQLVGNVTTTVQGVDAVDYTMDHGAARVEMVADDIVRVRFAPTGTFSTLRSGAIVAGAGNSPGALVFDTPGATYLLTARLTVAVLKQPFRVVIWRADGSLVQADLDAGIVFDTTTGLVLARKYAPPDEHYFGLGERGGPIDRRGRRFLMKNVDWAGYDELSDPLYISIPYYYGVRDGKAHGLFFDNPAMPFFEMDPDNNGTLTFGALSGDLDYYVFAGPAPSQVANAYGRITGFSTLPPKWSLGYHQSRYSYASETELLTVAATLRTLQIPADVLYLDIDYMDRLAMFTWNPTTFSSPIEMSNTLHRFGFKQVNIFEPLVRRDDPLWPYLAGSGFVLTDTAGQPLVNNVWYGDVSWIDFTKPSARDWYRSVVPYFLGGSIDGMWVDLNEPAQNYMDGAIYDVDGQHRTDVETRNIYALHEAAVDYDAQKATHPNTRPWSMSRSGFAGIQRYSSNWGGDENSTFDSMRVSVEMSISMGLSGQNQFGHDIGGFLGSPSAELFIRWLQLASFTPLFRNHAMNTSAPREPWAFGEPYLTMARSIIGERYRLLPYLYTSFESASRTGEPTLAPTFFYFPSDTLTYGQNTEFMVGPFLLVAPVLAEGATTRTLYLPAGTNWIDADTDTVYPGGQRVTLAAPLGHTPVFVREGAVVPKGPVVQFVDEGALRRLTLDLYPGPDTSFVLYEDDGSSFDFQQGAFLRTELSRRESAGAVSCTIRRVEGSWNPPADRSWWLQFHATAGAPAGVDVDGVPVPPAGSEAALESASQGWFRRPDGVLIVRVPNPVSSATVTARF